VVADALKFSAAWNEIDQNVRTNQNCRLINSTTFSVDGQSPIYPHHVVLLRSTLIHVYSFNAVN
jgi:hypothetical protein